MIKQQRPTQRCSCMEHMEHEYLCTSYETRNQHLAAVHATLAYLTSQPWPALTELDQLLQSTERSPANTHIKDSTVQSQLCFPASWYWPTSMRAYLKAEADQASLCYCKVARGTGPESNHRNRISRAKTRNRRVAKSDDQGGATEGTTTRCVIKRYQCLLRASFLFGEPVRWPHLGEKVKLVVVICTALPSLLCHPTWVLFLFLFSS